MWASACVWAGEGQEHGAEQVHGVASRRVRKGSNGQRLPSGSDVPGPALTAEFVSSHCPHFAEEGTGCGGLNGVPQKDMSKS